MATGTARDLRLDFFRGLALWLIFLDHVPSNVVSWFTIRNFGFSDAAEIFVFISGFTAAFVYGRVMRERGFIVGAARIAKRVWQLYVAFIFLFVIYLAEIAYVASRFDNPLFVEEMNALHFIQKPEVVLIEALLLKFRPQNMDVLPLYIVLMLALAPMLWLLLKRPAVGLALSFLIYVLARWLGWNLPAYPGDATWDFNPFAWQFLFFIGAWCAIGGIDRLTPIWRSKSVLTAAALYLVVALLFSFTWYFPAIAPHLPSWLLIYPIDKNGLSPLRILHFLALAMIVVHFVPRDAKFLRSAWAKPLIICGQHSLEVFCAGVFLSFTAHFVLVEVSARLLMQIAVSLCGILLMVLLAGIMSWYQDVDRRGKQAAA